MRPKRPHRITTPVTLHQERNPTMQRDKAAWQSSECVWLYLQWHDEIWTTHLHVLHSITKT